MTFVQTGVASADLLFAAAAASTDGASGRTFINYSSNPANLNPNQVWAYGDAATIGGNSYIYKHELLHALGLNHSTAVFGNNTNPIPVDQSTGTTLYGSWFSGYQNDIELFDIAALQYYYGPPPTQRAGNDTYTLNPGTFDPLSPQAGWPLLWDGGGFDTLDYSAFNVPVNISLVPGELSRINGATGHILEAGVFSINYRTVIEAVIGGSGNDTLKGNDANNTMNGALGNDTLDGGLGFDTAVFSGLRSSYTITALAGTGVKVAGPDGTDTLSNVERLVFNDTTVFWHPDGNPDFDQAFYLNHYSDVRQANVDPLDHYNQYGWHEGRDPDALFSTSLYLATNRDVKAAGVNPLDHYHQYGWKEGRDPVRISTPNSICCTIRMLRRLGSIRCSIICNPA